MHTPHASYADGEVRYRDRAGLAEDLEVYVRHGVFCVAGAHFPPPLEAWRALGQGGDPDLDPDPDTVEAATHPRPERP